MTDKREWQASFMHQLGQGLFVTALFDRLADIVFSVKDRHGRYVWMSETCVARCGLASRQVAVGLTAFDLFPEPMAERYRRQDDQLFRTGQPLIDSLDLTLYPDRSTGWCLTTKEPLRDAAGQVIGLACVSKDLVEPSRTGMVDEGFAEAIDYMHAHLAMPLRVDELARRSGLTGAQFDRRMKKLFQLSTGQYLQKIRIDRAAKLLADGTAPIAQVAQLAGFCDQSSLSRQFRQLTGLTPRHYRRLARS
ncbi:AraC family transcriptional regulator [Frateuria sp. Soil773]|uniref:AraC family transcriptional regulator n=1 Tax=Frateuria sp. Soil773 TaxID=1736407 RepID=UPI0006FB473B|nr:helix-turn-helix domain-containing protein [Frateuria sp. Soil773]KRE88377.1 AraC family transcriptional regulator [Frateuria sp. Soil773]